MENSAVKIITEICEKAREDGQEITLDYIQTTISSISTHPIFQALTVQQWEKIAFKAKSQIDIDIFDHGATLVDTDANRWLDHHKTDFQWGFWNAYKTMLEHEGRPKIVIDELDRVTHEILDASGDPRIDLKWKRRGLVMGNVQSGKTQNYLGLINKALDVGYKVIILLGGHLNELRVQTQERVDQGVVGKHSVHATYNNDRGRYGVSKHRLDPNLTVDSFTTTLSDFNAQSVRSFRRSITDSSSPLIFVIKKNSSVLKNLYKWIKEEHNLDPESEKTLAMPLMLIDDEADYASINTKKNKREVTAINDGIRRLLTLFKHSNYVGYTATPFANIFIDPDSEDELLGDDLFPRDYMVRIPVPDNYVGQQHFFIDDSSEIATHVINDHELLIPPKATKEAFIEELNESLKEAIRTFVVANAIRSLRGQAKEHTTMLVNVTHLTALQDQVAILIAEYVNQIRSSIDYAGGFSVEDAKVKSPLIEQLFSSYKNNYAESGFSFDQVFSTLNQTVQKIQTMAVHSSTSNGQALDYSTYKANGLAVIVVGGHKLSRGLTLEGLTVSYFSRNSKMYDTLMQMCRWFGYRPDYGDLCRLFITEESREWYTFIAVAINELYQELDRMERARRKPIEFGLKVRDYPGSLLVTARQKMDSARAYTRSLDFAGTRVRRFQFRNNEEIAASNRKVTSDFLNDNKDKLVLNSLTDNSGAYLFENVSYESVIKFINKIEVIDGEQAPNYLIEDYLAKLQKAGIPEFRVAVKQLKTGSSKTEWMSYLPQAGQELSSEHDYQLKGLPSIYPSKRLFTLSKDEEILKYKKQEAGDPTDESMFLYDVEPDPLAKSNTDFIAHKDRSYPGLIIYTFALGARKEGDEKNDPIHPVDGVYIGYSLSFPLTENLRGLSSKEREEITKKTKVTYQANRIWHQLSEGVPQEQEEDDDDE
jgi:hypothetical protein